MHFVIETEYCDVSYIESKNLVFVKWKKYCELDLYRSFLLRALDIINIHKCDYVADTRDGFVDNELDTIWVKNYFFPKALEYGCNCIYFIIDKNNSLKEELEGQERNSKDIIKFKYIYDLEEI